MVPYANRLLVFGGGNWDPQTSAWVQKHNDIYSYNPETNTWYLYPPTNAIDVCTFPCVMRVGFHILIFGGQSISQDVTSSHMYLFNPSMYLFTPQRADNTVTSEVRIVTPSIDDPKCRDMATLTLVGNNKAMLIGGNHGGPTNDRYKLKMGWSHHGIEAL